jgi:hypothetical protein
VKRLRILLTLIASLFAADEAVAVMCNPGIPFLGQFGPRSVIVTGRPIEHHRRFGRDVTFLVLFQVDEVLHGNLRRNRILIKGSGYSDGISLPLGKEFLLHIGGPFEVEGFGDEIYGLPDCVPSVISVEGGRVRGSITRPDVEELSIEELRQRIRDRARTERRTFLGFDYVASPMVVRAAPNHLELPRASGCPRGARIEVLIHDGGRVEGWRAIDSHNDPTIIAQGSCRIAIEEALPNSLPPATFRSRPFTTLHRMEIVVR